MFCRPYIIIEHDEHTSKAVRGSSKILKKITRILFPAHLTAVSCYRGRRCCCCWWMRNYASAPRRCGEELVQEERAMPPPVCMGRSRRSDPNWREPRRGRIDGGGAGHGFCARAQAREWPEVAPGWRGDARPIGRPGVAAERRTADGHARGPKDPVGTYFILIFFLRSFSSYTPSTGRRRK